MHVHSARSTPAPPRLPASAPPRLTKNSCGEPASSESSVFSTNTRVCGEFANSTSASSDRKEPSVVLANVLSIPGRTRASTRTMHSAPPRLTFQHSTGAMRTLLRATQRWLLRSVDPKHLLSQGNVIILLCLSSAGVSAASRLQIVTHDRPEVICLASLASITPQVAPTELRHTSAVKPHSCWGGCYELVPAWSSDKNRP